MTPREQFMAAVGARAKAAGLTPRELEEATGPLAPTTALEAVNEHQGGALLLLGPPGTGKTLAAARWMLKPILDLKNWDHDTGRTEVWYTPRVRTLVWRTAKSLSRVKQYETRELEILFDARRLVLDDLGQEYLDKAGFLASLLDEIVTERHRRQRSTVLTANQNADEFEERYGNRVFDRIAGDGKVVVCAGDSLRRARDLQMPIPHVCSGKDVAARIAACADQHRAEAEATHRKWLEDERNFAAARAAAPPPAPPPKRMTEEETRAKKAEITARLEEWGKRNGGTAS